MNQLFNIEILGAGIPKIAFIACVHGDELIGLRIFDALKSDQSKLEHPIALITANPPALKAGARFIEEDLNRVFPGNSAGSNEQVLASYLHKDLQKYDIIIDIHGTSSNIDSLIIFTSKEQKTLDLISKIPIDKIAYAPKSVFGGHELISNVKLGLSLEYGPDKGGEGWVVAFEHIKKLLINLSYMEGEKSKSSIKTNYNIYGRYDVPEGFVQSEIIDDFKYINSGDIIGTINGIPLESSESFFPLFVGKGKYPKIFALKSTKEDLIID